MLVSFLYPYQLRNTSAPHLWFFYYQLNNIDDKEIIYIGSEDYFYSPKYFENLNRFEIKNNFYEIPNEERLKKLNKKIITDEIFKELEKKCISSNKVWEVLIKNRYKKLEDEIEKYLLEIGIEKIDAILATCNCPSLDSVAKKYNLKVIYNEIGALREPLFRKTCYFDFSGVNGNTEFDLRWKKFLKEEKIKGFKYLGYDKLVQTVGAENLLEVLKEDEDEKYEIGIAFQIEDDSNMIAYSNGYNNIDLLSIATKKNSKENILLRKHPGSNFKISEIYGNIDNYRFSLKFLKQCKNILTINSSLALEAIFFKKNITILGEASFKIFSRSNFNDQMLEYYSIGYLVPFELMYNFEYIYFRLKNPSEIEIYNYHLKFWQNNKNKNLLTKEIQKEQTILNQQEEIEKLKILIDRYVELYNDKILELTNIYDSDLWKIGLKYYKARDILIKKSHLEKLKLLKNKLLKRN